MGIVTSGGGFRVKLTPVGSTAAGQDAGSANTSTYLTAFGFGAGKINTTGFVSAFGYQAAGVNVTGRVAAFGYQAASGSTVRISAFGFQAGRANTTGYISVFGYRAGYAPAGVLANGSTTGTYQTLIGEESGQASATQRNDVVAVGYQALVDADDAVAVGSGAQALHASAVALGKGVVTTAASQLAVGAIHIEATKVAAPGTPAAGAGRVYFDSADGSYKVKFDTGTVVTLATYA